MARPPLKGALWKTGAVDVTLEAVGFEIELISPNKVTGRLQVSEKSCQPFKFLHGGVSALISESLASIGAFLAADGKRVAGVQLSINHVKSAKLGDLVVAEATPFNVGKTIQVWEVRLWKVESWNSESKSLLSYSTVTLLCNIPFPEHAKFTKAMQQKLAKL